MDTGMLDLYPGMENTFTLHNLRDDIAHYHVNPTFREDSERIFVPCGVGNTDNGFFIYGIQKKNLFEDQELNVFAVVYNYLIRNSRISDADIPRFLRDKKTTHEVEYRSVFRLTIVLLQMIKNGYMSNGTISFAYNENLVNLNYAVELINYYAKLFSDLAKNSCITVKVNLTGGAVPLSLRKIEGIYVKDNLEFISNAREMWYGRKINYSLTQQDLPLMEYILREVSPYEHFREGQFEAICEMLKTSGHSVCIMPTGSGKSLVYYFLSLLQPLPIYVIAPTDILIQDQIRNLRELHHIDDIAHLKLAKERVFLNYEAHNKLVYLTPMTLQNRDLLAAFRHINNGTRLVERLETRIAPGALAAYIVLDEIHCLSNWGHDFRPEYLMLSRFLNRFLDNVKFRGFTATANYTVVKDVQHQLSIPEENFFSPIEFEKYNINYRFIACKNTEEMSERLVGIARMLVARNERTIIFTKNDTMSKKLAKEIGVGAEAFTSENPKSYYSFAKGNGQILIATEDLGVGINFPGIRNVIHFGLPLSKNEYIQEIGRAGRANEHVMSYVLYLSETPSNVPDKLLKRSTKIEDIPEMLTAFENDFSEIYKRITNGCPTKEAMTSRLVTFFRTFDYNEKALEVRSFSPTEIDEAKKMLYMLYCTGYVNDWYSFGLPKTEEGLDIVIDICATNTQEYRGDSIVMLNRMKERSIAYYDFIDKENADTISKVNMSETAEEILSVYVDWYYLRFLYHHNEQFLDLYEFILSGRAKDDDSITDDIKDYFKLPFTKLRDDEMYFSELSVEEIIDKVISGISRDSVVNAERIISDRYLYKLDVLLFFAHLIKNSVLENDRIERFGPHLTETENHQTVAAFGRAYERCDISGRASILNYIESDGMKYGIEYQNFFREMYEGKEKDLIFYAKDICSMNMIFRRDKQ